MGDLDTLRTAQAAVALCVLLLLSLGTYRPTRSAFAAWWIGVVAASATATAVYVVGEHSAVGLSAIVGNGFSVLATSFAWGATRSLRGRTVKWWYFAVPSAGTGLATWWEAPQGNAWPAGLSLLLGMATMLGCSAGELVAVRRTNSRMGNLDRRGEAGYAISTLLVASMLSSAFYVVRIVTFLAVGPDTDFYIRWVGPYTTTFMVMLMLVVVSYTVTALSHYEMARGWRAKATTDDLTGLLHRFAFLERVLEIRGDQAGRFSPPTVIAADIDHFKEVNDQHGHAYGDIVLVGFAEAVQSVLGESDIAARFGGEEFVVFLADATVDQAIEVTHAIDEAFSRTADPGRKVPTVSYGVACIQDHMDLEDAIQMADRALYRAKQEGRARTVAHSEDDD